MCWNAPPPRLVAGWLNWSMPTETDEKSKRDSQLCNQNCTVQLQFSVTAGPTWLPEGQWQLVTGTWGGKAGWRRGHEQGKGLYRFTVLHSDLDSGFGSRLLPFHISSLLPHTTAYLSSVWPVVFIPQCALPSGGLCSAWKSEPRAALAAFIPFIPSSCLLLQQVVKYGANSTSAGLWWLVLARGPWGDCGKSVH